MRAWSMTDYVGHNGAIQVYAAGLPIPPGAFVVNRRSTGDNGSVNYPHNPDAQAGSGMDKRDERIKQ